MRSTNTQNNPNAGPANHEPPNVAVLNKDLFFGVKIGNQLKAEGYAVSFSATTEDFAARVREDREDRPVLGLIDLNLNPDWAAVTRLVEDVGDRTPILVFGSHLDVDGLRAAKAAGVRRVVSNGEFHQNMIDLVRRYARPPQE